MYLSKAGITRADLIQDQTVMQIFQFTLRKLRHDEVLERHSALVGLKQQQ